MRNGAWLAFHAAQSLHPVEGAPSRASAATVRIGNTHQGVDKNPKLNFLTRPLPIVHENTDKDEQLTHRLEDGRFVG